MARILFIDDHALLRDTLAAWLGARGLTVQCCETLEEALAQLPADLVLLDLRLACAPPEEVVSRLLSQSGCGPILVMAGAHDSTLAERLLVAGVRAILGKSLPPEQILDHILTCLRRDAAPPLSPREREVLVALAAGLSNKEIARKLGLQEVTVKLHMQRLCRKLDARNRTHAALIGRDMGLV